MTGEMVRALIKEGLLPPTSSDTGLVERLRRVGPGVSSPSVLQLEAADRIESLVRNQELNLQVCRDLIGERDQAQTLLQQQAVEIARLEAEIDRLLDAVHDYSRRYD